MAGGGVGITANDVSRYSLFMICATYLRKPAGTKALWSLASDRVQGRNGLIHQAIENDCDWLLLLDDDQVFSRDLLDRLLARNVPVVGALYLQRQVPFSPIAYSERVGTAYVTLDVREHDPEALVEVAAVGTGGMLIRREVWEGMSDPWFVHHETESEDLTFCRAAREAGFSVYVDLGARMGHMSVESIWPSYEEDGWRVAFDVTDGCRLFLPMMESESR